MNERRPSEDDERTRWCESNPRLTQRVFASLVVAQYKEESEEAKRNVKALEKRVVQLEAELASPTNPDSLAVELAEVRAQLEVASAALRAEKNRSMKSEGRAERVAKLERDLDEMVAARAAHGDDARVGRVRWGHHRVRGARGIRQVSSINVMT